MIVLRQYMIILLLAAILSCLSTIFHSMIYLKTNYENDITRYIEQQQQQQIVKATPPIIRKSQPVVASSPTIRRMPPATYSKLSSNNNNNKISIMKRKNHEIKEESSTTTTTMMNHRHHQTPNNNNSIHENQDQEHHQPEENPETPPPMKLLDQHPQLYWNLSCPIELSMFSGVHMGGDFHVRAEKARNMVMESIEIFENNIDWKLLENRRIYFVGDSLLRQVFISMACLWWDTKVINYAIPWFEKRGVRMRQPNTIGNGQHSKFEEGRIQLKGNIELIFHHGIGNLLELGSEYQSHNDVDSSWLKSCYQQQPLTALVPKLPNNQYEQQKLSTLNVDREQLKLTSRDIVLINASVHGPRTFNLQNIGDLFKCKSMISYPEKLWPSMYYIVTGPMHFPTEDGSFEKSLIEKDDNYYNCSMTSSFHGHQDQEKITLQQYNILFIGSDLLPLEFESGDLHVGGKDCLHWFQPGIPDLVSQKVMNTILLSSSAAAAERKEEK